MRPAVIGIGSSLRTDEGIGPAVILRLAERGMPGWDLVDLGTGGMRLLHELAGRPAAVLVDCAFMELFPGVMRVFAPAGVRSMKRLAGFSLHEGDLLATLALARELGEHPPALRICAVEPADTGPGLRLSRLLAAQLDAYAARVRREALELVPPGT